MGELVKFYKFVPEHEPGAVPDSDPRWNLDVVDVPPNDLGFRPGEWLGTDLLDKARSFEEVEFVRALLDL